LTTPAPPQFSLYSHTMNRIRSIKFFTEDDDELSCVELIWVFYAARENSGHVLMMHLNMTDTSTNHLLFEKGILTEDGQYLLDSDCCDEYVPHIATRKHSTGTDITYGINDICADDINVRVDDQETGSRDTIECGYMYLDESIQFLESIGVRAHDLDFELIARAMRTPDAFSVNQYGRTLADTFVKYDSIQSLEQYTTYPHTPIAKYITQAIQTVRNCIGNEPRHLLK
jgi:hypothetical protein